MSASSRSRAAPGLMRLEGAAAERRAIRFRNAGDARAPRLAITMGAALLWTLARLALLSAWVGIAAAQSPHTHRHGFHGASEWARVFDDPKRDAWQKPHEVIEALGLAPDALVADIGAGTGYFASRFAHMVPRGRVYAVDLETDMVQYLRERAKREGLERMIAVQATAADANLPEPVDLVVFVDVYHHVEQRVDYMRKLRASLRPGGRIAVVDFKLDAPVGPPRSGRIAPERVKRELHEAGYSLQQEHHFLPHQYFLVFRPQT